jgi:predicted SAM-dependent methyltransferase
MQRSQKGHLKWPFKRVLDVSSRRTANGIIFGVFFPSRSSCRIKSEDTMEIFRLDKPSPTMLNIGGGKGHPKVPGWQVVDIRSQADIVMDISREQLPFDDNSVDIIFCSHTLEHIIPQRLDFVLGEFLRVMDHRNSLLRISVPDIEKAIRAYYEKDYTFFEISELSTKDSDTPMGGKLAAWFYSTRLDRHTGEESEMKGHVHCFDWEYLNYRLKKVGFRNLRKSAYRMSVYPELRKKAFDRHPIASLYLEAMLRGEKSRY